MRGLNERVVCAGAVFAAVGAGRRFFGEAFFAGGALKTFVWTFFVSGAGFVQSFASFASIERVFRATTSVFSSSFGLAAIFLAPRLGFSGDFVFAMTSLLFFFAGGWIGPDALRFLASGFANMVGFFSNSVSRTNENADARRGVIGMKGLGHGERMMKSVEVLTDLTVGTRKTFELALEGVLGSRLIGLKCPNSIFSESGDEQSLGVSEDELSWLSEPAGFELVEADVVVAGDPELLAIFEKKFKLLLKAFLKMFVFEVELPLVFDPLDEPALLKAETTGLRRTFS